MNRLADEVGWLFYNLKTRCYGRLSSGACESRQRSIGNIIIHAETRSIAYRPIDFIMSSILAGAGRQPSDTALTKCVISVTVLVNSRVRPIEPVVASCE